MTNSFDYFVVLAEMRTGSNLLEANLNAFEGITCHGEAFNPHFIGYPKKDNLLGMTAPERDEAPENLITTIIKKTQGLGGFRFFHSHDFRAADQFLDDPRCAKIILSRNPVESYVSWKIARETDQWRLTNHNKRRSAQIMFDEEEFITMLSHQREFRAMVHHKLQTSGQTAFHISYPDLQDLDIINGLGRFLGATAPLEELDSKIKKQNPGHLSEKVINFSEMERILAKSDFFELTEIPGYEPTRGANVPSYITAAKSPLLFMPVRGSETNTITHWMAQLDGADQVTSGYTQKTLRDWKKEHPGHVSFTMLTHPAERVHTSFCKRILNLGPDTYTEIRDLLRRKFDLPIPADTPGDDWTIDQHRDAFIAFLGFVKNNLDGKTPVRVDNTWASQTSQVEGICKFTFPDLLLRKSDLSQGLRDICSRLNVSPPALTEEIEDTPYTLAQIYNGKVETAVKKCYTKDYVNFGFGRWNA